MTREQPRNWTSLDLAKPVWEEQSEQDTRLRHGLDDQDGLGSVELVDMDSVVDTYGTWDQTLDILPPMSR